MQNLINCKCKTFVGSVAEMKGNEARVVFFLHPVDQLKDGKVSRVKPLRSSFVVRFLFLLGLLLGLGVLVYVFLQFGSLEVSFDTITESAVTGRDTEVISNEITGNDSSTTKAPVTEGTIEVISNQIKGNDATMETELPKKTVPPGVMCDFFLLPIQ